MSIWTYGLKTHNKMDINIGTSVRGRTTLLRDRAFGYTAFKAYKNYKMIQPQLRNRI